MSLACASAGELVAQSTLREFEPPQPPANLERFGYSLALVGDVDNDGATDLGVGSPQDASADPGRVSIVSGATGVVLRQIVGLHAGSEFGFRLAAVGDVDGDSYTDLLSTGPAFDSQIAQPYAELRLFSARTGATLWSHSELESALLCCSGWYLGGGDDVDGDSVSDFGAAGFWNQTDSTVRIWSGATQALILELGGGAQDPSSGPFALLGDLDGDQRSEIAYCARSGVSNGLVHIASGATGAVLRTCVLVPAINAGCFVSLVALDDLTGDGAIELAVADACNGRVSIFSSATAALLRTHEDVHAASSFGRGLAGGADLDSDGVGDVLIGAPYANDGGWLRGTVFGFSGRTGVELLRTHYAPDVSQGGHTLAAAGDVDSDGFDDFLVGSPGYVSGPAGEGRVWLHSPCPLPPRGIGGSKINSLGCTPPVVWSGSASVTSAQPFTISASDMLNQKLGTFFYGYGDPINVFFQGWFMYAPGPRRRTAIQSSGGSVSGNDCTGTCSIDFNARIQSGVDPALLAGARVVTQYWSRDPQSASTTHLTSAVEFVIGP